MSISIIETADLALVPTPLPTATWQPVPHIVVRNTLAQQLISHNLHVSNESNEITEDGLTAIGRFTLEDSAPQALATEVVYWNDHSKKRGVTFAAGERVFICANGCLFAESRMKTKRTANVLNRIEGLASEFVGKLEGVCAQNDTRRENYRRYMLGADYSRAVMVKIVEQGILPGSKLLPLLKEFNAPSFNYDHNFDSVLNLQSAVTHIAKSYNVMTHHERTLKLTNLLDEVVLG